MTSPFQATPIESTTNFLVDVSCSAIYTNSANTETIHDLSSETNSSLEKLQYYWTTCTESKQGDPGYELAKKLAKNPSASELENFIHTYLDGKGDQLNLDEISTQFLQQLLLDAQHAYGGGTSDSDKKLATLISSINSLITETNSTATNETQPLQTMAKTCGTLLQQDESAMSSDASVGSIGNETNSMLLSAINQPY